jgi:hypothetical protein
MKKLSLKLDDLKIDSFETTEGAETVAGTVRGHLDVSMRCFSIASCYACGGGGNEPTFRLSCPACTGPYCGSDDPSQGDGCYTGIGEGC